MSYSGNSSGTVGTVSAQLLFDTIRQAVGASATGLDQLREKVTVLAHELLGTEEPKTFLPGFKSAPRAQVSENTPAKKRRSSGRKYQRPGGSKSRRKSTNHQCGYLWGHFSTPPEK